MTTKCYDDWPTTVSKFRDIFEGHHVRRVTNFQRSGVNFMTPEVLGFVKSPTGEDVEVSTGLGIERERIFGVTYPTWQDERSGCHYSLEEVYTAIFGEEKS